ncbi:GNAT family N-acetyltransferase [Kribbella sp. CA-253562]|uniref:GNAT family N-acetyltransferase n=1 Tax=Kribbella sp. CA-253562 TaxID=3239942 RepID=UPI003D8BF962
MKVSTIAPMEYGRATEIWESSVRATHHFVSENDIAAFRPMVRRAFDEMAQVAGLRSDDGELIGFIGVAEGKVEMLFIDPACRSRGGGKMLLDHARLAFGATSVDVNEQNEQALGFYLHEGCEVVGRSELDSTGRPYPILHLSMAASASNQVS